MSIPVELQSEIDSLKSELAEGFELGLSFNPNFTKSQFAQTILSECRRLNIKFNEIRRSGQHPSHELRIAILAHKQLAEELGETVVI